MTGTSCHSVGWAVSLLASKVQAVAHALRLQPLTSLSGRAEMVLASYCGWWARGSHSLLLSGLSGSQLEPKCSNVHHRSLLHLAEE